MPKAGKFRARWTGRNAYPTRYSFGGGFFFGVKLDRAATGSGRPTKTTSQMKSQTNEG